MGFESLDPFKNLQLIFVAFAAMFIIPLLIKILWVLVYCCGPLRNLLEALERKIYWNFFIRFFLESYLELLIVALINLKKKSVAF